MCTVPTVCSRLDCGGSRESEGVRSRRRLLVTMHVLIGSNQPEAAAAAAAAAAASHSRATSRDPPDAPLLCLTWLGSHITLHTVQ